MHNDRFVILKRLSHKSNGGTWGLPAGKVEKGESQVEAIIRELYEETGFTAREEDLELIGDFEFGAGESSYNFSLFRIYVDSQVTIELEEDAHSEYKWVTAEDCYAKPNLIKDFHELLSITSLVRAE